MESEVASSFHKLFWHHSYSQSPSPIIAYRFGSVIVRRRVCPVGTVHVPGSVAELQFWTEIDPTSDAERLLHACRSWIREMEWHGEWHESPN